MYRSQSNVFQKKTFFEVKKLRLPIYKTKDTVQTPVLKQGLTLFILLLVMAVVQLSFLVLNIATVYIIELLGISIADQEREMLSQVLSLVFNIVADAAGIIFIWLYYSRRNFPKLENKPQPYKLENWSFEVGQLFSIALLGSTCISILANMIYVLIFGVLPDISSPYDEFLSSIPILALFAIAAVIMAPIYEELMFRKYSITCLEAENVNIVVALVVSSIFFGLIHTTGDLVSGSLFFAGVHLISTTSHGLILGFLYLKTQDIKYPMILHALINGYSVVTSFLVLDLETTTGLLYAATAVAIMFAVMAFGVLSLIIRIWRNRGAIIEWINNLPNSINIPNLFSTSNLITISTMLGGSIILIVGIPVLISIFSEHMDRIIYWIVRGTYWIALSIISLLVVHTLSKKPTHRLESLPEEK